MDSRTLLFTLEERIEDIKTIYGYYLEEGSDKGIIEMVPAVKYLLANLVDILNDGLISHPKTSFYSHFKPFIKEQEQEHHHYNERIDDFDRGLYWLIQKLNSNDLSSFIRLIKINKNYFADVYRNRKEAIVMDHNESFYFLVEKMEKSVHFDLTSSDLYKFTRRLKKREPEVEAEAEVKNFDSNNKDIEHETKDDEFFVLNACDLDDYDYKIRIHSGVFRKLVNRFINNWKKKRPKHSSINHSDFKDDKFDDINMDLQSESDVNLLDKMSVTICPERGLIAQNYTCPQCKICISSDTSFKCDFTGEYYCSTCHGGGLSINPLRILYNWDFNRYPICRASKRQIAQFSYTNLIDFPKINPKAFESNETFKQIHRTRKQIQIFSTQTQNNTPDTLERYKRHIWPKIHLLTSHNLYTIEDLIEIKKGIFHSETLLPLYNLIKNDVK